MIDGLPWIIAAGIALLVTVQLLTRKSCERKGHAWGYVFNHETQSEQLRCGKCGRWAQ